MKSDNFNFNANDGTNLVVYRWLPDSNIKIKAAVHIIHGMGEHAGRYQEFADRLTEAGYAAYSMDQRGHGKTAESPEQFGHFAAKDGWDLVLDDLKKLTGLIKKEHDDKIDIFLFGHSSGSFLSRDYMILDGKSLRGVILCGSATSPKLPGYFGIVISKYLIKKYGPKKQSSLHLKLVFDRYNSFFKPNRTDSDWATRDTKKVDQLVKDPYCYRTFSSAFYLDLIRTLFRINKLSNIQKIPKDIPVLFISGTMDALGGFTRGISEVYRKFKKAGIEDVNLKLYQDARHELVNELNREEVYRDIIEWFDLRLPARSNASIETK
jgi:alpha-beta hydrolase superfamily lysophospholipase